MMTGEATRAQPVDLHGNTDGADAAEEQTVIAGLAGEFAHDDDLLCAVRMAHAAGYRRIDAYAPYFVEELAEELRPRRNWSAWLLLAGLGAGATGGLALLVYTRLIVYPLNIGGRPLLSWPAFVPIIFVLSILTAALLIVLGFLLLTRLPNADQPIWNLTHFSMARQECFFLYIDGDDPAFDPDETRQFLARAGAQGVVEVEQD